MNAPHDLGGMRGFGPIDRSQTALFAEGWEETVFAITLACGMLGRWNLDQTRFAREQMERAHYLASTYYEHWLHGLERLLVERGLISEAELRGGKAAGKGELQAVTAERAADILRRGAPTVLPTNAAPLFADGDRVRVRAAAPTTKTKTHTRAPRYTQGREGRVVHHHGAHVFPDRHAANGDKQPQHLYGVRFEALALWGDAREAERQEENAAVYVDLFEPYLEEADDGR